MAHQTNAGGNPYQSASLYVGDLDPSVTEATLFENFNTVGPVASIRVCRDSQTRTSLGYAYVNFHTTADADRALDTMNFMSIKGKQCRIMWSQRDPSLRNSNKGNVFVKNLHETIDNKTLYDTFSVFGTILSCKVVTDPDTGKSRGYGYVHYTAVENAQTAIQGVNGLLIQGTKVTAELFRPRDVRIEKSEWTNVYVKFIPESWSENDLIKQLQADSGGVVDKSIIWTNPEMGTAACLNFTTHEAAKRLVEKYKGSKPGPRDGMLQSALGGRSTAPMVDDAHGATGAADDEKKEDAAGGAESKAAESGDAGGAAATSGAAGGDDEENEAEEKEVVQQVPRVAHPLYVVRAMKRSERDRFLKSRQKSRAPTHRPGSYHCNLYVKNLDKDKVDSATLSNMFKEFGKITSVRVMKDARTSRSRGFGFVCFAKKEDATVALEKMNNEIRFGKKLYVCRAMKKQQRAVHLQRIRDRAARPQPYADREFHGPPQQVPYGGVAPHYAMPPQFHSYPQHLASMNQFRMHPAFAHQQRMMAGVAGFGLPPMMRQPFHPMPGVSIPAQPPASSQQVHVPQAASAQMGSRAGPLQPSVGAHSVGAAQPIVNYQSASQQGVAPVPQPVSQSTAPGLSSQAAGGATGMTSVASQLSAPLRETQPLTPQMLKDAKPAERKRLIGERLFPKIQEVEPRLAGKITGMLLEMDNTELLVLLDTRQQLMKKINEALGVLKDHQMRQSEKNQMGPDSVIGRTSAGNAGSVQHAQGSQSNA